MKMAAEERQILLVDDEEKLLESIAQRMKLLGFIPISATSGEAAIDIVKHHPVDIAVVDLQMPGMDGLVTITKLKEIRPNLKTILLTGHGNQKVKQATEALNSVYFQKDEMGNFWSFIKGLSTDGNVVVIRPTASSGATSIRESSRSGFFQANEIEIHRGRPAETTGAGDTGLSTGRGLPAGADRPVIVGETPAMQELRKNIERVAALDCAVIIRGETGTGKELAARAIHALSSRRNHRFLAFNSAYLGNEQMLAQLLGYKSGDLSQAIRNQGGIFGSDPGGTLLFENVAELPDDLQVQLLKIIDLSEAPRHYKNEEPFTDIRILVATNMDLMACVQAGKFRKDLYYRLNLFELTIPPLRERKDDIAPLCSYFLGKYCDEFRKTIQGISREVVDTFSDYDFPGNVRELEHLIERAVIIADGRTIEKRHLPGRFQMQKGLARSVEGGHFSTLAQVEMRYILEVLEAVGGNKTRTAEILGISRAALWRKLKQAKADQPVR